MSTIILYTIKCLEVIKLPFILVLHPAHRARMKTLYYTAKPCFLFTLHRPSKLQPSFMCEAFVFVSLNGTEWFHRTDGQS